MSDIHVNRPEPISSFYRILPKYSRIFYEIKFDDFKTCLDSGLSLFKKGFRVFHQYCYEHHDPCNIQLAKIENIEKEEV